MTYGFILAVVWVLSNGDVVGETLNWYDNPTTCWEEAIRMKEDSEVGFGYVCIEDTGAET